MTAAGENPLARLFLLCSAPVVRPWLLPEPGGGGGPAPRAGSGRPLAALLPPPVPGAWWGRYGHPLHTQAAWLVGAGAGMGSVRGPWPPPLMPVAACEAELLLCALLPLPLPGAGPRPRRASGLQSNVPRWFSADNLVALRLLRGAIVPSGALAGCRTDAFCQPRKSPVRC